MSKPRWDEDSIIRRILALERVGEDLTCSNVKEIDSALVGAAISYFGNWGVALEAAGLDYSEIRNISKQRRAEKVQKWSVSKVLEEIKEVAKAEDDISYAYMKEKYSSLVAAANNYIGSWKRALEMLGFDYSEVLRKGRERRLEREKAWYRDLLLTRLSKMPLDENLIKRKHPNFHRVIIGRFNSWEKVMENMRKYRKRKERGKNAKAIR
ncbi:MAG: hypothetical protein AB1546_14175 [bacterium]